MADLKGRNLHANHQHKISINGINYLNNNFDYL
jgi:hypothetical protein